MVVQVGEGVLANVGMGVVREQRGNTESFCKLRLGL